MFKVNLTVDNIPMILWGEKSDKLFIAVHGNMSCKDDDVITIFAENAIKKGYQVLSFDLPEHGERQGESYICNAQNCVYDLNIIKRYGRSISNSISVFACSVGAYFTLLAYNNELLKQCLFLSPVVNMQRIINNMMLWFDVSEDRLKVEKEISTPIGQTLYWDYYCYVNEHPISNWDKFTAILYGSKDDLCESDIINKFVIDYSCDLTVMQNGEHYFHTPEQLEFLRRWVENTII